MNGRRSLLLGAACAAAWPRHATAQSSGKVFRLGWLRPTAPGATDFQSTGIPNALRHLGWVEGQNLRIEARYANGQPDRLPALARELVAQRCDAILAVGSGAVRAAKGATATLPIVMFGNFDPVALGLVASLARPGGNVTGVRITSEGTFAAKKLELLSQAVPRVRRMAMLVPDDPVVQLQVLETQQAAAALGIELRVITLRGADHAGAFATMVAERCGALFVAATTHFVQDRRVIIDLAARHKLPSIWEWPEQVDDGGLMSYGTSLNRMYQRLALYVDRIFKGALPADLPVEQPTSIELVINLKTARALGLNISPELLLRADKVIE